MPEILDIKEIDKFYRYEESLVHNMMWSDPMTESGFMKNPRGAGCLFGEDVANAFLAFNSLSIIVRSHQLVMEGYRYMFKKKLVTVWSAPNYCYKTENIACIMQVEKCDEYKFILFDKVDNQKNE